MRLLLTLFVSGLLVSGVVEEHGVDRINVFGSEWGDTELFITLLKEVGVGNQFHCLTHCFGTEVAVSIAELKQVLLALVGLECEVERLHMVLPSFARLVESDVIRDDDIDTNALFVGQQCDRLSQAG